jgi:hypothetical protein
MRCIEKHSKEVKNIRAQFDFLIFETITNADLKSLIYQLDELL